MWLGLWLEEQRSPKETGSHTEIIIGGGSSLARHGPNQSTSEKILEHCKLFEEIVSNDRIVTAMIIIIAIVIIICCSYCGIARVDIFSCDDFDGVDSGNNTIME